MMRSALFARIALLLAATVLLAFSNGRWIVPLATWIAPVLWLRYVEVARSRGAVAAGLIAYAGVFLVIWQGMVPAPGAIYGAIVIVYAVVYYLPFVVHRVLTPRLTGVAATLVFPASWVSIEYIFQTFVTPYGSWFSLAYTQTESLWLVQLASLTGTWGIGFLITWFAAVAVRVWGAGWRPGEVRGPVAAVVSVLLLVMLGGELRLRGWGGGGDAVRVAALVPDASLRRELDMEIERFLRSGVDPAEASPGLRQASERLTADLLTRTRREAAAGARVVAWSETAARIIKADEPDFLDRLSETAKQSGIALLAGYGVYHHGAPKPLENRVAAVDADGKVAWLFDKANPIVGAEGATDPGDGVLRVLHTPAAAITVAICHDFDFPGLIRQAVGIGATLLIDPSADWREITAMHANMAMMRVVETGIPLVRPTSGGRTLFTDAFGVTLAREDDPLDAVIAHVVPTRVFTLYGRLGDFFAYLCMGALALLAITGAWGGWRPGAVATRGATQVAPSGEVPGRTSGDVVRPAVGAGAATQASSP